MMNANSRTLREAALGGRLRELILPDKSILIEEVEQDEFLDGQISDRYRQPRCKWPGQR